MKERLLIEAIVSHIRNMEVYIDHLERMIVQGDRRSVRYEIVCAVRHSGAIMNALLKDMQAEQLEATDDAKFRAAQEFIKEHRDPSV